MPRRSQRVPTVGSDYASLLEHPELIGKAMRVIKKRYYLSDAESLVRLQRLARDNRTELSDVARGVVLNESQLDLYA